MSHAADRTAVTVNMPKDLAYRLKAFAEARWSTQSMVAYKLIEEALDRYETRARTQPRPRKTSVTTS